MHKLIALAVTAATTAFAVLPAGASDNPMRDRVQRWQARMMERALGPDYASRLGPRPEIVGGTVAPAGKWPFQVGLVRAAQANNYFAQFCGGTLVHNQFVITAAHCITEDNGTITPKASIQILFGTQDLENGGTRRTIAQIKRHPSYNNTTANFDIAVIKLTTPTTGINVFAKMLESVDENTLAKTGTQTFVIGWGNLHGTGIPDFPKTLRQVNVPMVGRANCNDANSYDGDITMQMICAGVTGKDSCEGDSGGPLLVKNAMGQWRTLAGIVSWGSEVCGAANLYGVYARVATLRTWAKNTIVTLGGPAL